MIFLYDSIYFHLKKYGMRVLEDPEFMTMYIVPTFSGGVFTLLTLLTYSKKVNAMACNVYARTL